ncbi:MAG TPA: hypothetical protein VHT01_04435 [Candidatus Udaeobacter sp.]|jgi:hypothetical protein|nr:hypothetical protein [Candidatus Udaeobacter sp.]
MPYTSEKKLETMRSNNNGFNKRLSAQILKSAKWLEAKGPEEFSRLEIRDLQLLRKLVGERLYLNAVTKAHDDFLANPECFRAPNGNYRIELTKRDL